LAIGEHQLTIWSDSDKLASAPDRNTLALPLENCMKKNPAGLELWLHRTCTITKLSKQDVLAALKRTYKNITEYFKPRKKNPKENADGSTPT
jgi:hypothetical protein